MTGSVDGRDRAGRHLPSAQAPPGSDAARARDSQSQYFLVAYNSMTSMILLKCFLKELFKKQYNNMLQKNECEHHVQHTHLVGGGFVWF